MVLGYPKVPRGSKQPPPNGGPLRTALGHGVDDHPPCHGGESPEVYTDRGGGR